MKLHTLTAPSIQAALLEARRRFGDDVVLLESVPAQGDQPARITIMVDEPQQPERLPFGYAGAQQLARKTAHAAVHSSATAASDTTVLTTEQGNGSTPPVRTGPTSASRRGQLFPTAPAKSSPAPPTIPAHLTDQIERLHRRLARLEQQLGGALVGASHRWLGHPLASELLRQGLRPSTVIRLFDRLVAQGFDPEQPDEQLRWALAREMRRQLAPTAPRPLQGTQVVIGPAGAGKTTLLLKLARHASFFGRRTTAVLVLLPEEADSQPYLSPVELYRRFELPVQTVATPREMTAALRRVQSFDQILIDTPPLPLQEAPARRLLLHLRQLLGAVLPLQVLFCLNATCNLEDIPPQWVRRLPLAPDALVLTHLDEVRRPGRLYDWLVALACPVVCVSRGVRVPDSLEGFSPAAFIEYLLRL
ncbi:flagellar biosynthesis protein FlhF [Rhodothermus profundi]|uniref:Flagellar biosynthesis protein FlhF n=1 Tax=Rhodothermus profundi TaxID=633813 RepID=A0A1M6X4G2_9BACT|nr:flagellar biosynthesis protein FlhF [Rhodothermus profundi]SHL00813.1 flagellar biosynthesis protein FlhF [Rhodothermus profundi]